jgi:hypothetical protein
MLFFGIYFNYLYKQSGRWQYETHPEIDQTVILTLSLLMSYVYIYIYLYLYGAPSKARNLMWYIYGQDVLLGISLLEPYISLRYT